MFDMRTVSPSAHVLRKIETTLDARGVPPLSVEQAAVVAETIGQWYGVPLDLPSTEDVARRRSAGG
jgi:hypothetical protein